LPVSSGGSKVIIAPDGGDAWAPAKPRPDETLIRALARAHRWKRMLEEGRYRSAAEIAEAEGLTRSFVNRMMRLTLLAPDIVEAIPEGAAAEGVAAEGKYRSAGELAEAEGVVTRRGSPSRRCVSLRRSSRAGGAKVSFWTSQQN
jgi:hypothetical protein